MVEGIWSYFLAQLAWWYQHSFLRQLSVLCEFMICLWPTVIFILFNCIPKMSIFNHHIVITMSFTNLFDIQESDINTLLAFQNLASLPPPLFLHSLGVCLP